MRPNLEYGCNIWSVIYKKDAILLENVQRRATKLVSEIRHLSYSERLRSLGIPTLQYRRLRADMTEVFKIFNGIDIRNKETIFPAPMSQITRGHPKKIHKKFSRTNIRKYSLLPESCVCLECITRRYSDSEDTEYIQKQIKQPLEVIKHQICARLLYK